MHKAWALIPSTANNMKKKKERGGGRDDDDDGDDSDATLSAFPGIGTLSEDCVSSP